MVVPYAPGFVKSSAFAMGILIKVSFPNNREGTSAHSTPNPGVRTILTNNGVLLKRVASRDQVKVEPCYEFYSSVECYGNIWFWVDAVFDVHPQLQIDIIWWRRSSWIEIYFR